jgi:hypothetical protein
MSPKPKDLKILIKKCHSKASKAFVISSFQLSRLCFHQKLYYEVNWVLMKQEIYMGLFGKINKLAYSLCLIAYKLKDLFGTLIAYVL